MWKYYVYFIKSYTKSEMRYGIYDSFYAASTALIQAKGINPHDEWYIEEKYTKE